MYETICVPVDGSEHSNRAVDLAIALAQRFGARLVGTHVYAAGLHGSRFKQMEFTLPDKYRGEKELRRQRALHGSLVSMGLRLIADCYLDEIQAKCQTAGVPFEGRNLEGRHYRVLVDDIRGNRYDLVVMGALGMGAVEDSQLGSVCARVVRSTSADVLVVRDTACGEADGGRPILVGIDGSPQSFAGLKIALALARAFGRPLEAVGVYDPHLHHAMFRRIAGSLSGKASKIFRFEEQERLHGEITDSGLAKIYQSHLQVARRLARQEGISLIATLLDGKAFEGILRHARRCRPWLIILGRVGIHADDQADDLGSHAENLLRLAPGNVLLTGQRVHPPLDVKAEEGIAWSEEALERMSRVPGMVRGIARAAILQHAIERGHTVITSDLIDAALDDLTPAGTSPAARQTSRVHAPEGGARRERTPGRPPPRWSAEAQKALSSVSEAYLERRVRARIEKAARIQRLETITLNFAESILRDTLDGSHPPERASSPAGESPSSFTEAAEESPDASHRGAGPSSRDRERGSTGLARTGGRGGSGQSREP